MYRLPLLTIGLTLAAGSVSWAGAFPPGHEYGVVLERPCTPCHTSHGEPDPPLLPDAGDQTCLDCHGPGAQTAAGREERGIVPSAHPRDILTEMKKVENHSRTGCRTCHTLHYRYQSLDGLAPTVVSGMPLQSTLKGFASQAELCLSCHSRNSVHGEQSATTDIERLLRLENRSYHPVLGTAPERAPSVIPDLVSAIVNCTDCHGNDDAGGPKGPHGSRIESLLRTDYTQVDGWSESSRVYALCYACHERKKILESRLFPEHGKHIVEEMASCSTCHDAHGSVTRRALIRFGEGIPVIGVSESMTTGRLEFVSDAAGSGACYLTCHGKDHSPEAYGPLGELLKLDGGRNGGMRRPRGIDDGRVLSARPD